MIDSPNSEGEEVSILVVRPKLSLNETEQLSAFVGKEGQRDVFFLKYTGRTATRKSYKVFNFRDEADRRLVCFADAIDTNNGGDIDNYINYCFIVQATVKRHQATSADGIFPAATTINRIKILKTIGHPEKK
jgi:hypothetical protein